MKLSQMEPELGDPAEEQYLIEEVSDDDIAPITHRLREFALKLEGFSFLNFLTVNELREQARKQFTGR